MPQDADQLRILADFARLGIRLGLIAPASVVAWADSLIAATDAPPAPWLVELSLGDINDPLAIGGALKDVPGPSDLRLSVSLLNALVLRLWQKGETSFREMGNLAWRIHSIAEAPKEVADWGLMIDHIVEMLDDGYMTQDEVEREIERVLTPFAPFLHQLPHWA